VAIKEDKFAGAATAIMAAMRMRARAKARKKKGGAPPFGKAKVSPFG